MENVLLALSPFVVALLAQGVKKLALSGLAQRKNIVRIVVAFLAFGSAVGSSVLTGEPVDLSSVQAFANELLQALAVFLGASGAYFLSKKEEKPIE